MYKGINASGGIRTPKCFFKCMEAAMLLNKYKFGVHDGDSNVSRGLYGGLNAFGVHEG